MSSTIKNVVCKTSLILIVGFTFLTASYAHAQQQFVELRVDGDNGSAIPPGLGDDWGLDAYKYLQDAIARAEVLLINDPNTPVHLWVAATDPSNPYRPDRDANNPDGTGLRESTFLVNFNNVIVLGGFPPGGGDLEDRDPALYETVLSGAITNPLEEECAPDSGDCFDENNGTPGCDDLCGGQQQPCPGCCTLVCSIDPNCCIAPWDELCVGIAMTNCTGGQVPFGAYHVVTALNVDETVRIDGFTITLGSAGGGGPNSRGGGVFIDDARPAVIRCVITGNAAGGVFGDGEGGGMHITGTSNVTIVNCTFRENLAIEGGGLHLDLGVASATLVNCLFHDNDAIDHGGAIDVGSDDPAVFDVINCTFVNNSAGDQQGGAIFVEEPEVGNNGPMVLITNSILWFNTPDQIEQIGGDITVRFSNVQGGVEIGWDGGDNIDDDPLFVDPLNGDYRLLIGSPCIDVANNDDVPCDQFDLDNDGITCDEFDPENNEGTPDLDLINRVLDGDANGEAIVDMGSYEFRHPDSCPADLVVDGAVDVKDLLFLLGAWGPCPPPCPADLVVDGAVDVKDLLFLLGAWGPCPAFSVEPPSLADALATACVTQENWGYFLDVIETGSEAEKENWLCWMNHHLNVCTNCFCPHSPEICPGPDPF